MKTAFVKEVARSIKKAPGRFIAIVLIVAVGCGFFAGLKMSGIGMRKAADAFFDNQNLYNFELVSEGGISQSIVDDVASIQGVNEVEQQKSTDVVATFQTERYGCRIETLPEGTINQLSLESGRWPETEDECVVLASRIDKIQASDSISVIDSAERASANPLRQKTFHVVGTVASPEYTSSKNLGPTTVGSGILQQVLYVSQDAFSAQYPTTNLYIRADGGYASLTDPDGYAARTEAVLTALDTKLETYEQMQGDELRASARRLSPARAAAISNPAFYVLQRKNNYGAESYLEDSKRIDNIATTFPIIFFLVAALVALTTMTRMVDDERELIGTHKALGYHSVRIASKYLIYALLASCVGAAVGIAVFSQLLPSVIFNSYDIAYAIPPRAFPLPIEAAESTIAFVLGVGVTFVATLAACMSATHEVPASLMRERAPKPGKRILLERIGWIWKHLSFVNKVTLRNIFRYKKRLLMTLVGIAGCAALLLTGIGIRDSINDIIDKQFGSVFTYNTIVGLTNTATAQETNAASTYITDQPEVSTSVELAEQNMAVVKPDNTTATFQLVIPSKTDELSQVVRLQDRVSKTPITFSNTSCIMTEKLAYTLGLVPGDTFLVYETDSAGNKLDTSYELTLSDVTENYVNSYVYMGKDLYRETFGTAPHPNTFWIEADENDAFQDKFADALQTMKGVSTIIFNDETISLYKSLVKTMDAVMGVLIGAAALLACVVLYNLTNINIQERKKEIATLKVLGFTKKEVSAYVFKEIALLVILGAALGLAFGVFLEGYVIVTAEMENLMFAREIHWQAFVASFALTLFFAACVLLVMAPKLKAIDMVNSLKPGE